jgi:hypothetical protein
MTNAEILKRLSHIHAFLQHGPQANGSNHDEMLEALDESYNIINKLHKVDKLEKEVRKLKKELALQK